MRRWAAVSIVVFFAGAAAVSARAQSVPAGSNGNASSWQASELSLPQAWQVAAKSPGAVVAIVDTGVEASHTALAGRVLPGWNFVAGNSDISDDNGHGTALAGVVAATCPNCKILPVKVLGADLTGTWSTIAEGITWAVDHGAAVINLSIGGPRATDAVGAAVAYAVSRGVIVVAAAGNDGRNESFYPAMYPGVISVAGIDENASRYVWSNFGSWVSVAAPGCATTSWIGNSYTSNFCGTSTAAPFVSGVAGLARSVRPDLSPAQLLSGLSASDDPLPDASTSAFGRVDAGRLLLSLAPARPAAAKVGTAQATARHRALRARKHR